MAKHVRRRKGFRALLAAGLVLAALVAAGLWLVFDGGAATASGDADQVAGQNSSDAAEVFDAAASDAAASSVQSEAAPEVAVDNAATAGEHVSKEDADEASSATGAGDGGSYASSEVMISLSASLGEDELRARLAEAGVSVASVETVSTALEGDEVLVLVGYEGDEDAAELSVRLAEFDFVSSAQPDYLYTLAEDDVLEGDAEASTEFSADMAGTPTEDDENGAQAKTDETPSDEDALVEDAAGEADVAGDAEPVASATNAEDNEDEDGAQAGTASVSTNDPYRTYQWEHDSIGLSSAWDVVKCNNTVTVAVIDSGVDYDHPDLAANLLLDYAKNCHTGATGAAAVDDANGHGSHVSGIIAGVANNSTGVAGTSYNANILPVKTTYLSDANGNETSTGSDYGYMTTSDVVKALDYVVLLKNAATTDALANIRVVNLSIGGKDQDKNLNAAVQRTNAAGIVVVAAAGNDGSNGNPVEYPAAYDNVISVAALTQDTSAESGVSRAYYSCYNGYVDLAAPGSSIYSTYLGGQYAKMSGTSMATPVVSAVAALVCAADADATPDEVESILTETALDLGDEGRDDSYGYGEVQADAAVAKAAEVADSGTSEGDEGDTDGDTGEDSGNENGGDSDDTSSDPDADPALTPVRQGHWVCTAAYGQGFQRYWIWADGTMANDELITPANGAGYYAYATKAGYVVRGTYDAGNGYVYLADNDGRLEEASGWLVTGKYTNGELQRYWIDGEKHAAKTSYFTIDGAHYFGIGGVGYVLRGAGTGYNSKSQASKLYADNDGKLVTSAWVCTDAFGQGFQRYWFDATSAMAIGRVITSDEGAGYYAYATEAGYVVRGKYDTGRGRVYLADNDGRIETSVGWLVTAKYDGRLERYYMDANSHAARTSYFTVDGKRYFGVGGQGYVLRGYGYDPYGTLIWANNDGVLK